MSRPELGKPAVGDPVHVHVRTYDGRQTFAATITKVGRTLLTIRATDFAREWHMRIETQREANPAGLTAEFVTPDQLEYDQRAQNARTFLRSQGLDMRRDSVWAGDDKLVALAEILRANTPAMVEATR